MNNTEKDLSLLHRRVARLDEEYSLKAPKIIISTELELIKSMCNKLLKNLK